MFITAPALDCGRMLWDMGSRNKVKILKGMKILNFIHHLILHRAGTHFQSADKLHVKKNTCIPFSVSYDPIFALQRFSFRSGTLLPTILMCIHFLFAPTFKCRAVKQPE